MSDFASALNRDYKNGDPIAYGEDKSLFVEFVKEAVHQPAQSELEGRAVYKDVDFIRIMFPGDRTKTVYRPVNTEWNGQVPPDHLRFERQWKAYQQQDIQTQDGMPLKEWPPLTKSQVLELNAINIHTLEQLAAMPDTALTFMGARALREKAIAWLETAKTGSVSSRLVKENEDMKEEILLLKNQIKDILSLKSNEVAGQVDDAEEPQTIVRRGRPPKIKSED